MVHIAFGCVFSNFADGVPIEKISKALNDSHPAVTMQYLGITNKEVVDSYDEYEL